MSCLFAVRPRNLQAGFTWCCLRGLLVAFMLVCVDGYAQGQLSLPNSPVVDYTGTLSRSEVQQLEGVSYDLLEDTGAQLQVVIIESTAPQDIAAYSLELFSYWQLGGKGRDDGVLLLVAKADRRVRIEVGYGLEATVPNVVAGRIIASHITPHFRQGAYYDGIAAGVLALQSVIKEGEQREGEQSFQSVSDVESETQLLELERPWAAFDTALLMSMLFAFGMGMTSSWYRGRWVALCVAGVVLPVIMGLIFSTQLVFSLFFLLVAVVFLVLGRFYRRVSYVRVFIWVSLLLALLVQLGFYQHQQYCFGWGALAVLVIMAWSAILPLFMFALSLYSAVVTCARQSKLFLILRLVLWVGLVALGGWLFFEWYEEPFYESSMANILFAVVSLLVLMGGGELWSRACFQCQRTQAFCGVCLASTQR